MERGMKYRYEPEGMGHREPPIPRQGSYDRYNRIDRGMVDYYPQPRMYAEEWGPGGPYHARHPDSRGYSPPPYGPERRTPPPYGYYERRPYFPPSPPPQYSPLPPRYRDGPPPVEYYDHRRSPLPPPRSGSPPGMGHHRNPPQEHFAPEEDPAATRTLFVGNVDYAVTSEDLKRTFEPFGVVEEVKLKTATHGQSNPYAFVRFFNLNQAHIAKMEMSGKMIGRFRCRIGYGRVLPTNCVWIGGLGEWVTKQVGRT